MMELCLREGKTNWKKQHAFRFNSIIDDMYKCYVKIQLNPKMIVFKHEGLKILIQLKFGYYF